MFFTKNDITQYVEWLSTCFLYVHVGQEVRNTHVKSYILNFENKRIMIKNVLENRVCYPNWDSTCRYRLIDWKAQVRLLCEFTHCFCLYLRVIHLTVERIPTLKRLQWTYDGNTRFKYTIRFQKITRIKKQSNF